MPNRDSTTARIRLVPFVDPRAIADISYHDISEKPTEFSDRKSIPVKRSLVVGWYLYRITIFVATAENSRAI